MSESAGRPNIAMPIAEQWDGQTYYIDAIGRIVGHQETIVLANRLWRELADCRAELEQWKCEAVVRRESHLASHADIRGPQDGGYPFASPAGPDALAEEMPTWARVRTVDEMEEWYRYALIRMREAARKCGYALAVHGSMRRDLDLIAAPWVEQHSDKDALARAIQKAACGFTMEKYNWDADPKPCGRMGTVFPICWTEWHDMISAGHVDLSIMPDTDILRSRPAQGDAVSEELKRAVAKFPTWPTDPLHAVTVIGEEFGELTKAVLQFVYEPHKTHPDEIRKEAIQTAAMCLRFINSLDIYEYKPSPQHAQADAAMSQQEEK